MLWKKTPFSSLFPVFPFIIFIFVLFIFYHMVFEKYMNYTQVNYSVERDPFLFPFFLYGIRTSA